MANLRTVLRFSASSPTTQSAFLDERNVVAAQVRHYTIVTYALIDTRGHDRHIRVRARKLFFAATIDSIDRVARPQRDCVRQIWGLELRVGSSRADDEIGKVLVSGHRQVFDQYRQTVETIGGTLQL